MVTVLAREAFPVYPWFSSRQNAFWTIVSVV